MQEWIDTRLESRMGMLLHGIVGSDVMAENNLHEAINSKLGMNTTLLRTGNSQPRILPSGQKALFPYTRYSQIRLYIRSVRSRSTTRGTGELQHPVPIRRRTIVSHTTYYHNTFHHHTLRPTHSSDLLVTAIKAVLPHPDLLVTLDLQNSIFSGGAFRLYIC